MVVVGGATRLTQSGLSITEWKPVMGIVPPLSQDAWQAEFDKYRAIPQYAQLFPDMDLAGFKSIFYWEWAHRLLGRCIGIVMAVPLIGFWITGRLTPRLKPQLVGLFALGGLQGLIGWFMVKSGLSERTEVSQYLLGPAPRDGLAHLRVVDLARRGLARRAPSPDDRRDQNDRRDRSAAPHCHPDRRGRAAAGRPRCAGGGTPRRAHL